MTGSARSKCKCEHHAHGIPVVKTIVWSLHHKQTGEVWQPDEIEEALVTITELSARDRAAGITKTFNADVVESVNVHESIKTGSTVPGT